MQDTWHPCRLCGGNDFSVHFPARPSPASTSFRCTERWYQGHGQIVCCRRCGLLCANPRPDGATLAAVYATVEDPLYLEEEEGRRATFRHVLSQLAGDGPPGALLDVGCYVGTFLQCAAEAGWRPVGIEPSAWASEIARHGRGLEIVQGTAEEGLRAFPAEAFDVVTLFDVIEHFDNPVATLRAVHRVLRPGGRVYVSTIDISAPFGRLTGRWFPFLMTMHTHYFTRSTLLSCLEAAGLEAIAVHPYPKVLSVGYLVDRVAGPWGKAGRVASRLLRTVGLSKGMIPVPAWIGEILVAGQRGR
ncbi:MAG: class I SAM-dependent methyltransferase [Acidobacteriota bacterium]